MNQSELKYTQIVRTICASIIVFVSMIVLAKIRNPDSDMYWMIETGRWIYNHKWVPYTNPWITTQNVPVIVQQPLCALLNFFFYKVGGLEHFYLFAILENLLLLFSSYKIASKLFKVKFPYKDKVLFLLVGELILLNCGMITTRPYSITTLNMVVLVGSLFRYKKDHNIKREVLLVGFITVFQANYQMASLIAIPCFISCFFVGEFIKNWKVKEKPNGLAIAKWIALYVEFALLSCVNPYGIDGSFYLFKSQKAISLLKNIITETKSPVVMSILTLIMLLALISICYLIKRKLADAPLMLLCFGSVLATAIALRNAWMIYVYFVFSFIRLIPCINRDKKYTNLNRLWHMSFRVSIAIVTILIVFAGAFQLSQIKYKDSDLQEVFSIINNLPENTTIYTTFNTGGYVEFLNRKCYIDARPELYDLPITKSYDILNDWYNLEYNSNANISEFVYLNNYQYYFVSKNTSLDTYLKYGSFGLLWNNENYSLYEMK